MKHSARSVSRVFLLLGSAALVLMAGCRGNHVDPMKVARVRLIDVVPSPARLEFAVNGHEIAKNVEFKTNSNYINLDAGHYSLAAKRDGENRTEADVSGAMERGMEYTVLALPPARNSELRLKVLRHASTASDPKGKATLRFIAAASDCPKLSLALDNVIAVDGVKFGAESAPVRLAPGDYAVVLWTGDDAGELLGPSPIHLDGGHAYTVVAMGNRRDGSLTMQCYEDK